ncbi:MAG: FIST N-terminal domain-containing protein [Pikeienuella sp.]
MPDQPIASLKALLPDEDLAFLALFVSPKADFQAIVAAAADHFPNTDVVACTTAGEIGDNSYENDLIIEVGFPAVHFASQPILIKDISHQNFQSTIDRVTIA